MIKLFEFKSRYNQIRTFYKNGHNEYLIEGESKFFRVGEDYIDLQGGPFVSKTESLQDQFEINDNRKIEKITIEDGETPNFYRIRIKMI